MAEQNCDPKAQLAKVSAGLKEKGPFFQTPILTQKMTFVDGIAPESKAKADMGKGFTTGKK